MPRSLDRCGHGKTWTEDCNECEAVSLREFVATWEPKLIDAKRKLKEIDHDRTRVRRADRQVVDGGANRGCDSSVRARGAGNVRASEAVGMADADHSRSNVMRHNAKVTGSPALSASPSGLPG